MKLLILLLAVLQFTLETQKRKESADCADWGCRCVDARIKAPTPICDEALVACYSKSQCKRQKNGNCGYTLTGALEKCLANLKKPCVVGGCSGEICSDEPMISSCMFNPKFGCYKDAKCKRNAKGICSWTMTSKLERCLGVQNEPSIKPLIVPPY
jgi:hypothetical protein